MYEAETTQVVLVLSKYNEKTLIENPRTIKELDTKGTMKTEITEAHGVLLFSIDTTPKNLKK
jgi:hypothetical protein